MSHEVDVDFSEFKFPKFQIRGLRWILLAIIGVIFLLTFFYSVGTEEVGVIQRLCLHPTVPSGLHVKLPFRIETVKKVLPSGSLKRSSALGPRPPIKTVYDPKRFAKKN
jgi:regulator of protease activity HflC (stomatin/prohibitin superfamily)